MFLSTEALWRCEGAGMHSVEEYPGMRRVRRTFCSGNNLLLDFPTMVDQPDVQVDVRKQKHFEHFKCSVIFIVMWRQSVVAEDFQACLRLTV